jgi:hypothetical protein
VVKKKKEEEERYINHFSIVCSRRGLIFNLF